MKILITGGCGFVGSTLCINFKKRYPHYQITAFDNLRRRGSELNIQRLREVGVEFIHGDVRNMEDFDTIGDLDLLIDASADPSVLSGINSPVMPLINSNLLGTVNCLEVAARVKSSVVFLSTSRVYPIKNLESASFEELHTRYQWTDSQEHPGISSKGVTEDLSLVGSRSFYGASKLASELLIQEYQEHKGVNSIINRCGVLSGPWQMGKVDQGVVVLWLMRHFFKGSLKYIGYGGEGKQMRDVLHVLDLVDLLDEQIHNFSAFSGQIFNVGGGLDNSVSLLELTTLCQDITGNKIEIGSEMTNRDADIRIYITDNKKILEASQWKPKRDVRTTISETFEWLQNNEKKLKHILV